MTLSCNVMRYLRKFLRLLWGAMSTNIESHSPHFQKTLLFTYAVNGQDKTEESWVLEAL